MIRNPVKRRELANTVEGVVSENEFNVFKQMIKGSDTTPGVNTEIKSTHRF